MVADGGRGEGDTSINIVTKLGFFSCLKSNNLLPCLFLAFQREEKRRFRL